LRHPAATTRFDGKYILVRESHQTSRLHGEYQISPGKSRVSRAKQIILTHCGGMMANPHKGAASSVAMKQLPTSQICHQVAHDVIA
jgi:hypothetical protein